MKQEALIRAFKTWPLRGTPSNPTAWLRRVATNLAVDEWRHRRYEVPSIEAAYEPDVRVDGLDEHELRLLFMCCHPVLPIESQLAFTLKTVCGLGTRQIASALLASEEAVEKRIARAKETLRNVDFSLAREQMERRIEPVLQVLYLMFNEGFATHSGAELMRTDLCYEAILLADGLTKTGFDEHPPLHALLALMLFHACRLPSRIDGAGDLILLEDQDRSKWDHGLRRRAFRHFELSSEGPVLTAYHPEAAIAATHARAESLYETDWRFILRCYEDLVVLKPNPVVLLNQAIAIYMVEGAQAGLEAVDRVLQDPRLRGYPFGPAAKAEILLTLDRKDEAALQFQAAIPLAQNVRQKAFLQRRLAATQALPHTF